MELQEKIKFIRKLAEENGITAYDIGKNTSISLTSARNVLEIDEITPRNKTLNIILEYLENAIVGTKGNIELRKEYTTKNKQYFAAESDADYNFKELSLEEKLNEIYKISKIQIAEINQIKDALSSLLLDFEEYEIFKNTSTKTT